jgi:hypothetical protein
VVRAEGVCLPKGNEQGKRDADQIGAHSQFRGKCEKYRLHSRAGGASGIAKRAVNHGVKSGNVGVQRREEVVEVRELAGSLEHGESQSQKERTQDKGGGADKLAANLREHIRTNIVACLWGTIGEKVEFGCGVLGHHDNCTTCTRHEPKAAAWPSPIA